MSVLLITYDSNKPGQDCEKILDFIKSSSGWAQLSETSYAIQTAETPERVFQQLTPFLSENSKLFVINLTYPYAGVMGTAVNTWLERNLPLAS